MAIAECDERPAELLRRLGRDEMAAVGHGAQRRARPGDGLVKAGLIWLDKKAVDLYSRAKARFGFSDDFASKLLGRISKKK